MHIHPKFTKFMVKYNINYVLLLKLALWISVQLTKLLERSYQQHLRKKCCGNKNSNRQYG